MLPSAAWDLPAQFPWCPVLPLELDGILDPLHREDFPPFLSFFDERITYFERKGNVQLDTAFFFFNCNESERKITLGTRSNRISSRV